MNEVQWRGVVVAQEVFIRFLWRELLHYSTDKDKTQKRTRQAAKEISDKNTARLAEKESYTPEERIDFLHGVEIARESFLDITSRDETASDRSF